MFSEKDVFGRIFRMLANGQFLAWGPGLKRENFYRTLFRTSRSLRGFEDSFDGVTTPEFLGPKQSWWAELDQKVGG